MSYDAEQALSAARDAAAAGADILRHYWNRGVAVEWKADATPVTVADREAEQAIRAILSRALPQASIFGEEYGLEGAREGLLWLVDPLDGTKEFIRGNGEFTVNIALIEHGRPVLGVVHAPVQETTYWAAGSGTAMRRRGDAAPEAIAARAMPTRGAIVVHSRSHADNRALAAYIAGLPHTERRISGSSIKFCLVAAGEADLYPRFGRTMEWDTAAGQAVLEAAGGAVTTLDGAPLTYGKPGFVNHDFIARGR